MEKLLKEGGPMSTEIKESRGEQQFIAYVTRYTLNQILSVIIGRKKSLCTTSKRSLILKSYCLSKNTINGRMC